MHDYNKEIAEIILNSWKNNIFKETNRRLSPGEERMLVDIIEEKLIALRQDDNDLKNWYFIENFEGILEEYIPLEFLVPVVAQIDMAFLDNFLPPEDHDYLGDISEGYIESDNKIYPIDKAIELGRILPFDVAHYFKWTRLVHRFSEIKISEEKSFFWLQKELQANPHKRKESDISAQLLMDVVNNIRKGKQQYRIVEQIKSDGSTRKCYAPSKKLKRIQRAINKYILSNECPENNVFGFSGGTIIDAIKPHVKGKIMLSIDIKNAFPSIRDSDVFYYLTDGRVERRSFGGISRLQHGRFSWRVAKILEELTTYQGVLPQGAPTSPRLFDLILSKIDKKLNKLASNVGGNYTRYADNMYFSIPDDVFPRKVKMAILRIITGKRREVLELEWHKLRIGLLDNPRRMLGLNLHAGQINNTKNFKRRIRKAIHHVTWLLDRNMDYEDAWNCLNGLMSFAIQETLPQKLFNDFLRLEEKIYYCY